MPPIILGVVPFNKEAVAAAEIRSKETASRKRVDASDAGITAIFTAAVPSRLVKLHPQVDPVIAGKFMPILGSYLARRIPCA